MVTFDNTADKRNSLKVSTLGSVRTKVRFVANKELNICVRQDLDRVMRSLIKKHDKGNGEGFEYACKVALIIRTAMALHKAWHMTLLTDVLIYNLMKKFDIVMTWNLGVFLLKFRIDDGCYEIHRNCPYDYDSEFQDKFWKIGLALLNDHLEVVQALNLQEQVLNEELTASSGKFFRNHPGRLMLYPLQASTCAIIFFGGDSWYDAVVAAITGLSAGMVEYLLNCTQSKMASTLTDVMVGLVTGIVGGLFYNNSEWEICLSSVFLGVLYWFFYGTAFVIGLLEIIAGRLETGVVRFMAVSVKTLVLSLGATIGMFIVLSDDRKGVVEAWNDNDGHCAKSDFLDHRWWRIPLYLLCSISALGQYRMPINYYWRGLIVQLVGYEVQYKLFARVDSDRDLVDTAVSNALGAFVSVCVAVAFSRLIENWNLAYNNRMLHRGGDDRDEGILFKLTAFYIEFTNKIGIGRKADLDFLNMKGMIDEIYDNKVARRSLNNGEEEKLLMDAIVNAEPLNVWALLMPTVYQLVPGSLIARLWFNSILPDPNEENSVIAGLMTTASSLAVGLISGFGFVQLIYYGMKSDKKSTATFDLSTMGVVAQVTYKKNDFKVRKLQLEDIEES